VYGQLVVYVIPPHGLGLHIHVSCPLRFPPFLELIDTGFCRSPFFIFYRAFLSPEHVPILIVLLLIILVLIVIILILILILIVLLLIVLVFAYLLYCNRFNVRPSELPVQTERIGENVFLDLYRNPNPTQVLNLIFTAIHESANCIT